MVANHYEETMSLAKKIQQYIEEKKEFNLQELYDEFGANHAKETIRARVYESNKVIRTGRGSYILAGVEVEAIIEEVDTKEHIFKLVDSKIKYDVIIADCPYSVSGVHGGNRQLVDYDLITPEEFGDIIVEAEKLLREENSQIYFMIAGGKSSLKDAQRYINVFERTGLKLVSKGSYTKLTKSGKVCNMGKYDMPPETILVFSKSGKERFEDAEEMNYRFQRPPLPKAGGYRTEKPLGLIQSFIQRATKQGERILDLFAGSGVTFEAGLSLGRKVHGLEISKDAIENFILPRIRRFEESLDLGICLMPKNAKQTSLFDFL